MVGHAGAVSDVEDRFRAAVTTADRRSLERWAATGSDGVDMIRRKLSGPSAQPIAIPDRAFLDGLAAAIAAIAEAAPHDFLTAFMDDEWAENGLVCIGLGRIDDPEATRRLVRAMVSWSWTTRVDAVIGLGRRPDPRATAALVEALDDPDYLVRYHAFRSLTASGDDTALRALGRPHWPTAAEADMARTARDAIERRRAAR